MKRNTLIMIIINLVVVICCIAFFLVQQLLNPINTNSNIQPEIQNQANIEENQLNNEIDNNDDVNTITEIPEPIVDNEVNAKLVETESYYYNQLDEYAKTIYKKIEQDKEKLKTGTYVFEFGTSFNTLLHSENGEQTLNTAFQSAWDAFSYDKNDLFYIDVSKLNLIKESRTLGGITTYYISIGPVNNENYLQSNFQTQEKVEKAEEYIENIVGQIQEQTKNDTDIEKIKKVHDWLISVVSYDDTNEINKYNIYGAIHDKKAVCEGYARVFKYILEKLGVSCVLVAGSAQNSTGNTEVHAWNYVNINEKWYAIDITWDDPIISENQELTDEQKYKYYLKGSEEFLQNHTEDGVFSQNGKEFTYPTLSVENYSI